MEGLDWSKAIEPNHYIIDSKTLKLDLKENKVVIINKGGYANDFSDYIKNML